MQAETPPTQTRRRLYREPEDKKIAGVCSGLADYFGIDPLLVRLGFVVLTLTNGFGILAYALAALVIPRRPEDQPRQVAPAVPMASSSANWIVAAVVVTVFLIVSDGHVWWFDGPAIGFALVGVGIWLLVAERDKSSVSTTPRDGGTTLPGEATLLSDPSGGDDRTTVLPSGTSDSYGPQGEVPPPVPPWGPTNTAIESDLGGEPPVDSEPPAGPGSGSGPEGSGPEYGLSAGVFGLLLVAGGLLAMLVVFGALDFSVGEWCGALLLVVGIGMVVGAWRGHARPLLGIGLPVLGLVVAGEAIDLPLSAGAGDRRVEVTTFPELLALDTDQELLAGQLVIDLSDAPLDRPGAPPLDLSARLGIGELQVILPEDVNAEVDIDVDIGAFNTDNGPNEIDGPGGIDEEGGVNVQRTLRMNGEEGGGQIQLDLHVGIGEIEVRRG